MSEQQLFEVDETLTVGQIARRLVEAVRRSFPREVWVQGQIRNLSRSARDHVYFDLVDPVAAGAQPKASIAVTLFDSNRQIVNRVIKRTGNAVRIDDGVEVRIRANVDVYAPRGQVQLNMTSIDPEFTLGRLGADREQLLAALTAEGLIDANAELAMPLVPLRVALITSQGSAAHADFDKQLASSGYAFAIDVLSTRVQGEFAPEEIAAMIDQAGRSAVDVVAVVRGGGARTDLAAFDTEPVARAIARCQLPVLCGIGHEVDSSVADMVAHQSFKTPTACAQHLIEQVIGFDFALAERAQQLTARAQLLPALHLHDTNAAAASISARVAGSLSEASQRTTASAALLERRVVRTIVGTEQRLEHARHRLAQAATRATVDGARRCDTTRNRLIERSAQIIRHGAQDLDLYQARLSAVDPVQALRRGYSITTTESGTLVRDVADVTPGTNLTTRLADGTVQSTVTGASPSSPSTQDAT